MIRIITGFLGRVRECVPNQFSQFEGNAQDFARRGLA